MSAPVTIGGCTLHLGDCREVLAARDRGRFVKGVHSWRQPKPHWQCEWLVERYVARGMSASEIAIEAGCTENAVFHWLTKHGIPRRTVSGARQVKRWGTSGAANPMHGRTGALNPRYVDGSSPERQRFYARGDGKAFIREMLARDNYRCARCSAPKGGAKSLHVHHMKAWAGNPELRFDPANVVTLCRPCHSFVHSKGNVAREFLA